MNLLIGKNSRGLLPEEKSRKYEFCFHTDLPFPETAYFALQCSAVKSVAIMQ
jgi:hypothetical protein